MDSNPRSPVSGSALFETCSLPAIGQAPAIAANGTSMTATELLEMAGGARRRDDIAGVPDSEAAALLVGGHHLRGDLNRYLNLRERHRHTTALRSSEGRFVRRVTLCCCCGSGGSWCYHIYDSKSLDVLKGPAKSLINGINADRA